MNENTSTCVKCGYTLAQHDYVHGTRGNCGDFIAPEPEMNDITQLSTLYSNAIARAEKAEEELRRFAWQPIETAPRDGSIILTGGFAKNGWFIADAKFADGGWCQFDPRLDEYDVECDEPPYWLPLPPPPVRETP